MRQCSVQASVVSLSAARPYMAEAYTPLKVNSSAFEKLPKPNKEKKSSSKHFSFSGAMWNFAGVVVEWQERATWASFQIWILPWRKMYIPLHPGYGALCAASHPAGWHRGIHVLQQLQRDSLESNAILLTSVAAALKQGWATPTIRDFPWLILAYHRSEMASSYWHPTHPRDATSSSKRDTWLRSFCRAQFKLSDQHNALICVLQTK